jgi:hypothetical protein
MAAAIHPLQKADQVLRRSLPNGNVTATTVAFPFAKQSSVLKIYYRIESGNDSITKDIRTAA